MRCQQCGQANPENHKFCGMCGAKLQPVVSSVAINDDDPLELETTPASYRFEDRSRIASSEIPIRELDRQRELVRDVPSRSSGAQNLGRPTSPLAVASFPPDTVREEAEQEIRRPSAGSQASTGIGGPSLLGLGYDQGNSGFVYDSDNSDNSTPEYLLEEPRRGVSWRAWALLALIVVGAGLGYIQWRASHNQGRDLASILAGNGATVDPSGPVMTDKTAKSVAPKPPADSATPDAAQPGNAKAQDPTASTDAKNASAATGDESSDMKTVPDASQNGSDAKTEEAAAKPAKDEVEAEADGTTDEKAGQPESDGPTTKATKTGRAQPAIQEAAAQPKPLGDKDPLIVQADKYIQGRGVRQNCSTGINLLRQAVSAGNPAADVKLGALYWSGTCVTQSKVTAYQWFSRAHSAEPRNRWIERSRNSLYASMNAEERGRVSY